MKYTAESINQKINEMLSTRSKRKVVSKSLSLDKTLALIDKSLREKMQDLKYYSNEELSLADKQGVVFIEEIPLPLTTKNEKEVAAIMEQKGFLFSYHENTNKEKYYICVATR